MDMCRRPNKRVIANLACSTKYIITFCFAGRKKCGLAEQEQQNYLLQCICCHEGVHICDRQDDCRREPTGMSIETECPC